MLHKINSDVGYKNESEIPEIYSKTMCRCKKYGQDMQ